MLWYCVWRNEEYIHLNEKTLVYIMKKIKMSPSKSITMLLCPRMWLRGKRVPPITGFENFYYYEQNPGENRILWNTVTLVYFCRPLGFVRYRNEKWSNTVLTYLHDWRWTKVETDNHYSLICKTNLEREIITTNGR